MSSQSSPISESAQILVVDDEKVIRLTLMQALESLGHHVKTAINGEDALSVMGDQSFDLILCDLKMPGMDGMTFLEKVAQKEVETQFIMISAHGTVTNAVEAMKLGAVDFIQKPFTPQEIRTLVQKVLSRPYLVLPEPVETKTSSSDYETLIEAAKYQASQRQYDRAIAQVKTAIGTDPSRPQGFNLLGELQELIGDRHDAIKNYRVAIDLDPTYQAAHDNLDRGTSHQQHFQIP